MAEYTDKTVCSICLQDFTQPKQLDCKHSFCYKCLVDYKNKFTCDNQFPCPLCRRNISIPEGGVAQFFDGSDCAIFDTETPINIVSVSKLCDLCSENSAKFRCQDCKQNMCQACKTTHDLLTVCRQHVVIEFDKTASNQEWQDEITIPHLAPTDCCPNHQTLAAACYCKDCAVAVCYKCHAKSHHGHEFDDLEDEDTVKKIKQDLEDLNQSLDNIITTVQDFSNTLEDRLTQVNKMAEEECLGVEHQIEKLYGELKKLGNEFKHKINKTKDEENSKIKSLQNEMEELTFELKSSVKNSRIVLDDQFVVKVIDVIPKLRKQKTNYDSRKLNIPVSRFPQFTAGLIDLKSLEIQVGQTEINTPEITFSKKYNLNSLNIMQIYDFTLCKWGWQLIVFDSIIATESTTRIPRKLKVNTKLTAFQNPDTISCDAKVVYKLHNIINNQKSIQIERELTFEIDDCAGAVPIISWEELTETQTGFIDGENNFTLDVMITITNTTKRT